jgi:ABC-type polysaccharide/polyol phosphate transport system ATPase subunit
VTNGNCAIRFRDLSLIYDLYYDKTNSFKEFVINFLYRRRYVETKKEKLYALRNINLRIDHGERVGIIGLNGSGKSTMLKVIAGLLKPSAGNLDIRGTVQPLIEIGAGFNPELSGRDNIYLNGAMLGFSKSQIKAKEREIIEFTELGNFIDVPVKYYSSGMTVRLAFTIATVIRPEILVLDEMLSAGDLEFNQKAKDRIDSILSAAKILVIVSHDMGMITSLTRRVIVLNKGEILFDGDTEEAIEFYMNMISDNIERKEEERADGMSASLDVATTLQEEVQKRIIIKNVNIENLTEKGKEILPNDDVAFGIEFESYADFDKFFINLVIKNKTNTDIAHFRNDFSGIDLSNFKKGHYKVTLPVFRIPFRSNPYKYYFRLVGMNGNDHIIEDSPLDSLQIMGDVKKDNLIEHEWKIEEVVI